MATKYIKANNVKKVALTEKLEVTKDFYSAIDKHIATLVSFAIAEAKANGQVVNAETLKSALANAGKTGEATPSPALNIETKKNSQSTLKNVAESFSPHVASQIPNLHISSDFQTSYIPTKVEKYFPRKLTATMTDVQMFEWAMDNNQSVLLQGHTGTGKTSLSKNYAFKKKQYYTRIILSNATIEDIVGHFVLTNGCTNWVDGAVIQAMRYGHLLVLDEVNSASPEILFVLNSLLDDDKQIALTMNGGEIVKAHPDFRVVACINPTELSGYSGTKEMNEAFLDKFVVNISLEYDEKIEKKILENMEVSEEDIFKIQRFIRKLREAFENGKLTTPISTRTIKNLVALRKIGAEDMILNRFKVNERTTVNDALKIELKGSL